MSVVQTLPTLVSKSVSTLSALICVGVTTDMCFTLMDTYVMVSFTTSITEWSYCKKNFSSSLEVHECLEGVALCEQHCSNTAGSYVCSCNPGYVLGGNGFSCTSKNIITVVICWIIAPVRDIEAVRYIKV